MFAKPDLNTWGVGQFLKVIHSQLWDLADLGAIM